MNYINYQECDIYEMINRTREVSKDPYKLFVATVLLGLMDMKDNDEDIKTPIGMSLNTEDVEDLIEECKEDFIAAIESGAKIDVNGTTYTIRNAKNVSKDKLNNVFNLKNDNGTTTIKLQNIFDVTEEEQDFSDRKKEKNDNRIYFQKIIYLAEATEDGYDSLTDMEVASYCWALFHRKNLNYPTGCYMFSKYFEMYEKFFCQPIPEVESCMVDGIKFPQRYFDFSAVKIREWNKKHNQKSIVDSVDEEKAIDYWYDVASVKKFLMDK